MTDEKICPGCERHCDLSAPACGKGREFAKTGVLPKCNHNEEHHRAMREPCYYSADTNEKLIINLRDIGHMMRMQYEGKASQKRILIILHKSGKLTQKELTERLGIQPGSASEILFKLENAGLIVRVQNETDRRTTNILLTDLGEELASEAADQRQKRHEEMFVCLTSEEKMMLLSLLEKVSADWETRFTKPPAHGHHCHHREHRCHGDRHHMEDSHFNE